MIFISIDSLGSKTQRYMWNEIPKKFVNIFYDSLFFILINAHFIIFTIFSITLDRLFC